MPSQTPIETWQTAMVEEMQAANACTEQAELQLARWLEAPAFARKNAAATTAELHAAVIAARRAADLLERRPFLWAATRPSWSDGQRCSSLIVGEA